MTLAETIRLDEAAKLAGVHVITLRRWLEAERGLVFARRRHGQICLIEVSDFEAVQKRHMPKKKWAARGEKQCKEPEAGGSQPTPKRRARGSPKPSGEPNAAGESPPSTAGTVGS
jgi:hypothetical protein